MAAPGEGERMINTYDRVDKATFDIKGLSEYLNNCIEHQRYQKIKKVAEAEAYYQGYYDAVHTITGILEASNYRVKEVEQDGKA